MVELQEVIGDYPRFLDDILGRVVDTGIDLRDFGQLDHMCYRAVSTKNYEQKRDELAAFARLLGETMVNRRRIAVFCLDEPIIHGSWSINALEITEPKAGSKHQEGLQHIEFVLGNRLDLPTFLEKYNGLPFDMKAANREIDPTVELPLDKLTVKFHTISLLEAFTRQQKQGVTDIKDN